MSTDSSVTPVQLITFGRCGSTFLMHILASSDRFRFNRTHPYEVRELAYMYRVAQYLCDGTAKPEGWNQLSMTIPSFEGIGPFPFHVPEGFFVGEDAWKRVLLGLWQGFVEYVQQTAPVDGALFYAEKMPHDIAAEIRNLLPMKDLFLLRDIRDEFVSIREFNAKRGFSAFGWLDGESEIDFAHRFCGMRETFLDAMLRFEDNEQRLLLRYEALMNDLERQLDRIGAFFGIDDFCMDHIRETNHHLERHRTAPSDAASIERWRNELDPAVLDIIHTRLGDRLERLGYPI